MCCDGLSSMLAPIDVAFLRNDAGEWVPIDGSTVDCGAVGRHTSRTCIRGSVIAVLVILIQRSDPSLIVGESANLSPLHRSLVCATGARVDLIEVQVLLSCRHRLLWTEIVPRELSALEPLTVINDSVRVVELTHLRDGMVSMLIDKLDQLALAIVLEFLEQVLIRHSQEINKKVDCHVDMRLIVGVVAAQTIFRHLFGVSDLHLDLLLDKLT